MNDLYQTFLQHITDDCFPSSVQTKSPRERAFLKLRFHPDNREKAHTDIAQDMREILKGEDCASAIGTTCQNVVREIAKRYEQAMTADGVEIDCLLQGEKGKKGAWEKVYTWLETKQFPRWRTGYIWQEWRDRSRATNWMSFHTNTLESRGLVVPPPIANNKIERDKSLIMQIEIADKDRYLLLLNRGSTPEGSETRYVMSPSAAFAPQIEPVASLKYLPQEGARCRDIQFDSVGREEYIGILLDRLPLDRLSWLNPSEGEPAPIWDDDRLYQLWLELEQQGDRGLYYQSFDVVNSGI
jgi:hypothetical protein